MNQHVSWQQAAERFEQAEHWTEAEGVYRQVLQAEPMQVEARYRLGLLYVSMGRDADAAECFRQVIRREPEHVEALTMLGITHGKAGKRGEAEDFFRNAVRIRPEYEKAHHNLGVCLAEQRRSEEAAASFLEALRLRPDYAEAHYNLGTTYKEMGRRDDAIASFRSALEYKPDYADAMNNLGLSLNEVGRTSEAVVILRQAIRLKPTSIESHNNLALALSDQGQFSEAMAELEHALRLSPNYVDGHVNMGNLCKEQGRSEEAIACYDHALRLEPNNPFAHWNRSLARLQSGDFERGWEEYEWRWKRNMRPRTFPQPFWDGTSHEGRTLLIHMEQGLGDMIQFIRYAAVVKEQRGGRILVECPGILLPLFRTCAGIDELVAEGSPLPPFDAHAPLLSLPRLLKTLLETVPATVPYLFAIEELVDRWRDRITALDGFRIGIAWQGNPHHQLDRHRSIPLSAFAPLAKIPGLQFFSLQKGTGSEQLSKTGRTIQVLPLPDDCDQASGAFMDTAAILEHLDLVITADTAIVHLAAAMGKRTWLVLSAISDWRWMLERDDSPWYPSLRIFRQETLGDWKSVMTRMAAELRDMVSHEQQ